MNLKEISDKKIWEDFLSDCEEKTFLSSWNWGEFQREAGNKIWRWGVYENNNLISAALIVKISAKRGTFLFVPHGPVVKEQKTENKEQILRVLSDELKDIAKKERASFIRIAPILPEIGEGGERNGEIFKKLGFINAPIHMHPELTWELDVSSSEGNLLAKMRKTTRYLIRQAQKNKDIEIIQSQRVEDIENFNNLYQRTVGRRHFAPFSLNYLKNEFSAFIDDNQISIFLGKYKGELLSSGIFVFWQGIGFYHHGASSLKYPKIPVSYALQWEAIKEAKKRGCQKYNFWGIAPIENFKRHPWAGLTLFKIGFGGCKKEYVKTKDFPLSNRYWPIFIFEKLRKTKRGL